MSKEINRLMQAKMELVAAMERGGITALADYLRQQTQQQSDLIEFAAALLATAPLPAEETLVPDHLAMAERATQRALAAVFSTPAGILTLSAARRARGLSLVQVARHLRLGTDVLDKLEKGRIVATSVPQRLLDQLAALLMLPVQQVSTLLEAVTPASAPALRRQRVASSRADQEAATPQTFAEAVRRSPGMTDAQREEWLNEIAL